MTTEMTVLEADETPVAAPLTLFGTQDPAAIVARATDVATALTGVINSRGLYKRIRDRDHIFVEGWTLLGSMLGVFAEVEWSRPVDGGWEARAVARTLNGNVVGAAEAMCTKSEGTWKGRDEHAIRSMAQTRAVSKALRLPLGFIIELAGYSATPAEELNEAPEQGEASPRAGGATRRSVPAVPAQAHSARDRMLAAAREHHVGAADLEKMAALVGVPSGQKASDEQIDAIIRLIETGETDAPNESATAEGAPVLPPAGAPNESADQGSGPAVQEAAAGSGSTAVASEPDAVDDAIARAKARAAASKKGKDIQPEPEPIGLPL